MAALSVAIMLLSSFVPIFTYVAPLVASLFLIPVMEEMNGKWVWMTWVAVSLISLMLCTDKEASFFYLFIGWYPMVKPKLDKIVSPILRIVAKLLIFGIAIALMYGFLYYILKLDVVMEDISGAGTVMNIVYFAVMMLIMICFDVILKNMIRLYNKRIKPLIKRGRR